MVFRNGHTATFDYVLAADGIHSAVRRQLVPDTQIRYAVYTCWRGVTDTAPAGLNSKQATETYASKGSDDQARYYSLMALGQMGGPYARDSLLETLRKGSKALERPWAAVALGVLNFREMESAGVSARVDDLLGKELVKQLENKNPSTMAANVIALGLTKFKESGPELQALLETHKNKDELAGYICIGLALMGQTEAIQQIQDVVSTSTRRAARLRQAAIALGKLGDKSAAQLLMKMLTDDSDWVSTDKASMLLAVPSSTALALTVVTTGALLSMVRLWLIAALTLPAASLALMLTV